MRLKSLKVSGFKSFCHPVELEFQQNGITIVVGPNGCGKSNVVDAIRWVLGEQRARHLRGGSMEDVIFAGSAFQKPSGLAEVTLTFLNPQGDTLRRYHEYSEIAITRRLYRNGESAYLINKTPVRLMDIRELFMDTGVGGTGYSIVEQGRVGEIVSAKPQDRRTLIDDAAGIIKFRTKRQAAERRLEETQQNLLRVSDLLGELKEQEEGLRDQVEKAQIYLSLKQKSETLELQSTLLQWQQARQQESSTEQKLAEQESGLQELQSRKSLLDARLQQVSLDQVQRGNRLSEQREALYQQERKIQEAESLRTLERQNLNNLQDQRERRSTEREELARRITSLEAEQQQSEGQSEGLALREEELRSEIEQVEQSRRAEGETLQETSQQLQSLQRELLRIHTELTNQTNQQGFLEERLGQLEGRRMQMETQRQVADAARAEIQTRLQQQDEQLEVLESQQQDEQAHLEALESQLQELLSRNTLLTQELAQQRQVWEQRRSRKESLEQIQEQHEGFDDSVRQFLEHMKADPEQAERLGVLGLLADHLEVLPERLDALAPVLSEMLNWVLIRSQNTLSEVESFCREQQLGRLHLIPLDLTPAPLGGLPGTPLSEWLRFSPNLQPWAERFFQNLRWHPDAFQSSFAAPPNSVGFLGDSGTLWWESTVRVGIPRESTLGFLKRQQELVALEVELAVLKEQLERLEAERETLEAERETLEAALEENLVQQRERELELLGRRKEREHTELELQRAEQNRQQLEGDRQTLEQEVSQLQARQVEVRSKLGELEEQRVEREDHAEQLQHRIEQLTSQMESVGQLLLERRVLLSEIQEQVRGLDAARQRLHRELEESRGREALLASTEELDEQKTALSRQRIEDIDASFGELLKERDRLKAALAEESARHAEQDVLQEELREQLRNAQRSLDETSRHTHEASIKLTEFRMQRTQWEEKLSELTETPLESLLRDLPDNPQDVAEMMREIRSIRSRLNAMGAVNLAAPEEHALLLERLQFIAAQSGDLQQAIEDLKSTIQDINRESRKRFREMFEQINVKFGELFSSLFGGGEARMILTDSEDLLEAGVDIVAQPPGKKLQNLNLLSGGEKALTAISLIFAIFLIKPSPFCLLDEVDAPLDDANVARFNQLIRKLTDNSQFIIITHNKKTMEIGDRLYGVTMEDPGISKTVSVQFQEAEQLVA